LKIFLKTIFILFLIPSGYLIISLILTYIPTKEITRYDSKNKVLYLKSNGVHVDYILPYNSLSIKLRKLTSNESDSSYVAFGWGDRNFYLNTPTWGDLSFKTAFKALFWKSETLLHLTIYNSKEASWKKIPISENQEKIIKNYIFQTLAKRNCTFNQHIVAVGYANNNLFYPAKGSYSCLYTCNSWINSGLKKAGLKTSIWTPFHFKLVQN
jgi:uncharacterized protein (TIGR02117 family)